MGEHTPVSEEEAAYLHDQGWASGFGWKDEADWYWSPSHGEPMSIGDHPDKMALWLADREQFEAQRREDAAHKAAPQLLEALASLLDRYDEERGVIDVEPDAGCLECTAGTTPDNWNTGPCAYHRARAAVAAIKEKTTDA